MTKLELLKLLADVPDDAVIYTSDGQDGFTAIQDVTITTDNEVYLS